MTPETSPHRLVLLRHAKSQWPDDVPDRDRPLAERGIADATAAGPILAGLAAPVDLVLCSPAVRARQTWNLTSQAFAVPPPIRYEPVIYGAEPGELLELFRSLPEEIGTVLLVGHEPTLSGTAELLAGAGSAAGDLARLRDKFPTCALATFQIELSWAQLVPKRAVLEQFQVPRG